MAPQIINGLGGGVGIILGIECGDDWLLGGFDLDTCRTDGSFEDWAKQVMDRFASYTEISPSLTGAKIFFRYRASDLPRLRAMMGTAKHSKIFSRSSTTGHPPAIELHLSNRYFTVTGDLLDTMPNEIRAVEFEDLAWILSDIGPQFSRSGNGRSGNGKSSGYNDNSRSGIAFRKVLGLRQSGKISTYDEMYTALMADPETASWVLDKGLSRGQHELQNLWDKTTPTGPTPHYKTSTTGTGFEEFADIAKDKTGGNAPKSSEVENGNRCRMEPTGLFYYPQAKSDVDDEDTEVERVWLSAPFEIVALARDPEGNWGKLLRWYNPDGEQVKWVMPNRLLGGKRDELFQSLYEQGLKISTDVGPRNHLLRYLNFADTPNRAQLVSRIGWHTDKDKYVFVLPDQVFGESTTEFIYSGTITNSPYQIAGTKEEWRNRIGEMCIGNSRLGLSASIGFAGPLLQILNADGGGFHLLGSSQIGKSTGGKTSGSVCGGGPRGYQKSWRATSNSLEAVAEQHCDTLLCLDEMGQVDAREAGEAAYMLANGHGKGRATRSGEARTSKHWRVIFVSSGEISLADKLAEINKKTKAGQEIRLINIPADAGKGMGLFEELHGVNTPKAFAEQLSIATSECYGAPFREYLRLLTEIYNQSPTALIESIRTIRNEFIQKYLPRGASQQVGSVCGRFGIVVAAGKLATAMGLTGWPDDEAEKAASTCFFAWLDQRGSQGDNDMEAAIDQVTRYIEQYGNSRFEVVGSPCEEYATNVQNRVGFRERKETDGPWFYYVLPEQWKTELTKGYNAAEVAKEMVERGLLIPDGTRTAKTMRIKGYDKSMRVYCLSSNLLGGDCVAKISDPFGGFDFLVTPKKV